MRGTLRRWFSRLGGWYSMLLLVSLALCWQMKGSEVVADSVEESTLLIVELLPVYAGVLLAGGFAQALLPRDLIARWLGTESGFKGLAIGALAGLITPGGPFVAFPMVLALFNAGADVGALLAFLSSWAMLGLHRFVIWDVPLLGFDIAMLRFIVCLPLPLLAGWLARGLRPLFSSPTGPVPGPGE